ncbi:MAG: DUF1080 domain-containing protein [Planctomycetaceae bacterium]
MIRIALTAVIVLTLAAAPAPAQKKKGNNRRKAVIDAKKAGPDFKFQGEYVGQLGGEDDKQKWGLQVIARGDGTFDAVAYGGGLPGAGWNGEDKITAAGKREGKTVTLTSDRGTATIQDGVATIKDADGDSLGSMKKVTRKSPTLGAKPPKGAVVLFDGSSAKNFVGGKKTEDGLLMPGTMSKQKFQSCTLHMEFLLSYMPYARGQGRSNSGVYLQGRYEVQILDSFGLEGKNNECGGIYGVKDPAVNMCLPPLQWQTYDITFTAAKYDDAGKKTANARMTVKHNGVLIHDDVPVPKSTRGSRLKEGAVAGPLYIQNHGNPLRFRNIWVVKK